MAPKMPYIALQEEEITTKRSCFRCARNEVLQAASYPCQRLLPGKIFAFPCSCLFLPTSSLLILPTGQQIKNLGELEKTENKYCQPPLKQRETEMFFFIHPYIP